MGDNTDFENELADSIAQIIDEEAADAKDFVQKNMAAGQYQQKLSDETKRFDPIRNEDLMRDKDLDLDDEEEYDDYDNDDEDDDQPVNKKKIIIIIAVIVAAIAAIVFLAIKIIQSALDKSIDNYGYYNNNAYKAFDAGEYDVAIENFLKALSYEEGKNNIDMMMYLYDCYVATNQEDEAQKLLYNILEIDPYYTNALIYLINGYDAAEDYQSIKTLYETYQNSEQEEVLALFKKYLGPEPKINVESGHYSCDQVIRISTTDDSVIYYTMDGRDPVTYGTLYESIITVGAGTTTIKYYSVNQYGFNSDVYTAEYTIVYEAPEMPLISPASGSYSTTTEQFITIGNVSSGTTAYYTLDGTTPTEFSKKYTGPFVMPEGNSTLQVIVIDSNGLKSEVATAVYSLTIVSKYSDTDAMEAIWNELQEKNYVDAKHLDASGKKYELAYYSKKTIQDKTIWMFTVTIDGEKQAYYYGADADTGVVYEINASGSGYELSSIKKYVPPVEEPTEGPTEGDTEDPSEEEPTDTPTEEPSQEEVEPAGGEADPAE